MRGSSLASLATLVVAGTLAGCGGGGNYGGGGNGGMPPPANTEDFDVALNTGEVVGGGADSGSASASVTVNMDDGSVSGTVTLSGLTADGVSLHRGFAGEAGPVVFDLGEDSSTRWSFADGAVLGNDDMDALERGGLYLEVATAAAADGAVRGQIVPDEVQVLFVHLSGMQEIPPLDTTASAIAALTLGDDGTLVLHLNTAGLDDAAEAHIHDGVAGANGPILIGLVQDPDDVSHWSIDNVTLDSDQQDAFAAGELYVNVHTPANPGGEVRGQVEPDGVDVFFTSLGGDDVVPPASTTASGVAAATLVTGTHALTLHVNLVGLDDAQAVSVHQAPVMQNGPAVLSLEQDPDDLAHWFLDSTVLDDAQNQALGNQGLYVSVETAAAPGGVLRGQLAPDLSTGGNGTTFLVQSVDPADGATVDALPATLRATFNRDVLASSAGIEQVDVTASGGDGSFGDGNELSVEVLRVAVSGADLTAELDTGAATDDVYRLSLDGSSASPITDTAGVVMDGDADGSPGGDFVATFTIDSSAAAPTLTELQADIFSVSCAKSGCHAGSSPAQGMNLSAGQTFANIVGVASHEVASLNRIEPGNPDDSYLVRKISGTASVGGRMPLDGPPFLTNAQIQNIRDWVAAGAQND